MKYSFFKIALIIILLGLLKSQLPAKLNFDITGYIHEMPSVQKMPEAADLFGIEEDDDYFFLNITRLRLRPTLKINRDLRIEADYEINMLASKISLPYLENTGMTNRQAADLNWTPVDEKNFKLNHFIDRLYFKQMFSWGEILGGRQVLSWGVGRIWQPTDLFNPINPANFSKIEKDGADAFSAKVFLGDFTDMQMVYNFREKLSYSNFAGRFRSKVGEYDLSGMAGYFDDRIVIGGDFTGYVWDGGLRGEGIYSGHNDNFGSGFFRFIIGYDYQITSKLYALAEYQYNGEGTDDKAEYIELFGRLMKGEIQNLGLNYLAVQANYIIHPLVNADAFTIANLDDGSGMVTVSATWSALDNMNLSLAGVFFYGPDLSEYSYYSTAAYITAQYFF